MKILLTVGILLMSQPLFAITDKEDESTIIPLGNGKILIRTVYVRERVVDATEESTNIKNEIALREKTILEARKQNEEALQKQASIIKIIETQSEEKEKLSEKLLEIKEKTNKK